MQAGHFRIGQLPDASQVAGQVVLLVDEVHDSGRTAEWARNALVELGAAAVLMAVIHYKPGANATGYEPDFYVETMNGWVHYPWEPIDSLRQRLSGRFAGAIQVTAARRGRGGTARRRRLLRGRRGPRYW